MNKLDFFKKNDEKFLALGFVKDETDPQFHYEFSIIPQDQIEENGLSEDEVPKLLIGNSGLNSGACIYTGEHFVWFACGTPEEAIEFAKKIVAIEPV